MSEHWTEPIIFLHIPKAGGATLYSVLRRQYEPQESYFIGSDVAESIKKFKKLSNAKKARLKCVAGHMQFGLDEFLPRPAKYVTILRDPIERIISHYYYARRSTDHYLHDRIRKHKMSLVDYVTSDISSELVNSQTRLLSGCVAERVEQSHLSRAIDNLDSHFLVAGTVSQFDETLLLLQQELHWGSVRYTRKNVGPGRPELEDNLDPVQNAIAARNQYDIQLYQYVATQLRSRVAASDLDMKMSVVKLRFVNRLHNGKERIISGVRQVQSLFKKANR